MGESWLVDGEPLAVGEGMPGMLPKQGSGMEPHDDRPFPPKWGQGGVASEGQLRPQWKSWKQYPA